MYCTLSVTAGLHELPTGQYTMNNDEEDINGVLFVKLLLWIEYHFVPFIAKDSNEVETQTETETENKEIQTTQLSIQ